jgi:EmrB/QacA subfamily drug resistance transporter
MSVSSQSPSAAVARPIQPWLILAIILLADIVDLLDATITTIAAPSIAQSLGGGPGLISWLGASYALSMGVLLVPGGRLGDKFGRKRLFLFGVVGFTAASVACGLAISSEMIILARVLQGAFGALMIPQGFGIISQTFTREQMGQAFSAFGPVLGLSAVAGPIVAGALINANIAGTGWRAAFLINLLVGIFTFVAALLILPQDDGDAAVHIDIQGAVLLAASMIGLLFGIIQGAENGWPPYTLGSIVAGALLFLAFAWQQRRTATPLLERSLFRNRGFVAGLTVGLIFFAVLTGLMLVVGLFVQTGLGYSPFEASLVTAPIAVGIVVSSIFARNAVARLGRRLVFAGIATVLAGMALLLTLLWAMPDTSQISALHLTLPLFIIGLGAGPAFAAVFDVALGDIAPEEAGSASGSMTAVQQLASAAGAASISTIYLHAVASNGQHQAALISLLVVAVGLAAALLCVRGMPRAAAVVG